jgi:hypothetical protein
VVAVDRQNENVRAAIDQCLSAAAQKRRGNNQKRLTFGHRRQYIYTTTSFQTTRSGICLKSTRDNGKRRHRQLLINSSTLWGVGCALSIMFNVMRRAQDRGEN